MDSEGKINIITGETFNQIFERAIQEEFERFFYGAKYKINKKVIEEDGDYEG